MAKVSAIETGHDVTDDQLIDATKLEALRQELGANFGRVVGYFREDGAKSITAIEEAARQRSAVALVRPSHTLKGDALQFGATGLGALAERIEEASRQAVEDHDYPVDIVQDVVRLRPEFDRVVAALTREASTATTLRRAVGFGRKAPAARGSAGI